MYFIYMGCCGPLMYALDLLDDSNAPALPMEKLYSHSEWTREKNRSGERETKTTQGRASSALFSFQLYWISVACSSRKRKREKEEIRTVVDEDEGMCDALRNEELGEG